MMRLQQHPTRRLFLQPGEICPVVCRCGCIYVPSSGAETSDCPVCRRHRNHLPIEVDDNPRLRPLPFGSGV